MLDAVMTYLEKHTDQAIETLKDLVRIPSVAAKGEGIDDTVTLLKPLFEEIGMKVQIHPTSGG